MTNIVGYRTPSPNAPLVRTVEQIECAITLVKQQIGSKETQRMLVNFVAAGIALFQLRHIHVFTLGDLGIPIWLYLDFVYLRKQERRLREQLKELETTLKKQIRAETEVPLDVLLAGYCPQGGSNEQWK